MSFSVKHLRVAHRLPPVWRMRTLALLLVILSTPIAARAQDGDPAPNINERYTVESVEITGVDDAKVSQELRDRLQSLVGGRLDRDEADRLDHLLSAELPGYEVTRRISRGSQPGRIRVVFDVAEAEPPAWIRFTPPRSKFVYHSNQGWSGALDIPIGVRDHRVTVGLVFDNDDDLIEEYSGFRVRLESRRMATRRLGASFEISHLRQSWREATMTALAVEPGVPEAYRARLTADPSVTLAIAPGLRVTGGLSVSRLESLSRSPESLMASAAVVSVGLANSAALALDSAQDVEASYRMSAGLEGLGSDLTYRRHHAQARYALEHDDNMIVASAAVGYITGQAPLFERFSLGDSTTLRGWSKFDVAPAGGRRMFHTSAEYRFHHVALFLDTGAVWDTGIARRTRVSTGFGFHGDNAFLTLGFPLNADGAGASFLMGVRF